MIKMLAATSPLPPPFQGAVEPSNGILVTREIEQVRLSGRLIGSRSITHANLVDL